MAGSISSDPGSFNVSNGNLELNGTLSQTISGSNFSGRTLMNLVVSNTSAAGLQISSAANDTLNITGTLSFGNTTSDLSTNDNLTLKSTASRTANVGQLAAGNIITGNVIVERYLLNGRKWRLLSAPTNSSQSVKSSWLENGLSQASSPNGYGFWAADTRLDYVARGFDAKANNTSVKIYNGATDTWDAVDNTTSPIKDNLGYMAFVPGDRKVVFPASNATTLRTKGQLYMGNQPTITVPAGQFKVIGNPFASAINKNFINVPGIDQAFYIWDPSIGGSYGLGAFNTFVKIGSGWYNLLSSPIYGPATFVTPHNNIESGAAFIVRGTTGGAGGSISFKEADKVSGSSPTPAMFTAGAPELMRINLNLAGTTPLLLDGAMINFGDEYSNQVDQFDIRKMGTITESVGLRTSNQLLVIDRRFTPVEADTVHIDMTKMTVRNYQWEVITDNMDAPGRQAFLLDRYLNISTPLNMAGTTTVNFSIQNIAGSYAPDRFKIVFRQAVVLPVNITSIAANRNNDKTVTVLWKVQNELNLTNYEVQRSIDGRNFESILTQLPEHNQGGAVNYQALDRGVVAGDLFYRIKAISLSGQVQFSATVKVTAVATKASITVYPNPVTGKQMQVRFIAVEGGLYQLQLLNAAGQTIYRGSEKITGGSFAKSIQLGNDVAGGRYDLLVIAPDGTKYYQPVFIQ